MPELVLITGASSDIGLALSRNLLSSSADTKLITHCFRGAARLEELAAEFPGRVIIMPADLTDADAAGDLATRVLGECGVPTGVVHLPALRPAPERFTKWKWPLFEQDFTVQLRSLVTLLQTLLPRMAKLDRARVVLILSSYVHGVPPRYLAQYTVIKYAQLGLMRSLAAEYASSPVRINAVSPSMVETQFLQDLSDLTVQGAAAAHPLGRNAVPQDVIGAIQFLLSPASDYISGVALPVAGGTVN